MPSPADPSPGGVTPGTSPAAASSGPPTTSGPSLGLVNNTTSSSTLHRAAGFRQIDTVVRRMGDFGDYYFDGSWKASSFANPTEYLDAAQRTPWTKTLHFRPKCGLQGPPALWELKKVESTPVISMPPVFESGLQKRHNNLPGYAGYIPGRRGNSVAPATARGARGGTFWVEVVCGEIIGIGLRKDRDSVMSDLSLEQMFSGHRHQS